MSEENKPKYIRVFDLEKANLKYEEGYKIHSPIVTEYRIGDGNPQTQISYLMGLSEPSKYDDIEKYRRFPITEQEQTLPKGWCVLHHTSKELIGVKKTESQ